MSLNLCSKCGVKGKAGTRDAKGAWMCSKCLVFNNVLHYDRYNPETDSMRNPFQDLSEEEQRSHFIDFCYQLFGGLNKQTYALIPQYLEKYSYLEMTRAIEFFYIVKKNSKEKANKSIGIIPYVIAHSNEYYKIISNSHLKRDRTQAKTKNSEAITLEVQEQPKRSKVKMFSMEDI